MDRSIIWSTCHSATAPGVHTRMGLSERSFNRQVLAGFKEVCSGFADVELYDLIDSAPMNWRRARALHEELEGPRLLVEVHLNSNGKETLDGWKSGALVEYHRAFTPALDIASKLIDVCEAICPPHKSIGIVAQPGNSLYPRAAMFGSVEMPAVLIEPGLVQDPDFCGWTDTPSNCRELGTKLAGAIIDWLKSGG